MSFHSPLSIQFGCPSFTTGPYTSHATYLPCDQYAVCLDNIKKACVDMLIFDENNRLCLGKRCVYPQKDFWCACGGRMMPGESLLETSKRLLQREMGLCCSNEEIKNRIDYLCSVTYEWAMREQEPKENGTSDVVLVVSFKILPQELEAMKHDHKEYSEMKFVEMDDVNTPEYHPALVRLVDEYRRVLLLRKLESSVENSNEKEIAVAATAYVTHLKNTTKHDKNRINVTNFL